MCRQPARVAVDLDAPTGSACFCVAADVLNTYAAATRFKFLSAPNTFQLDRATAGVKAARHIFRSIYHKGNACIVVAEPSRDRAFAFGFGVNGVARFVDSDIKVERKSSISGWFEIGRAHV